jgi:hypothetical protein
MMRTAIETETEVGGDAHVSMVTEANLTQIKKREMSHNYYNQQWRVAQQNLEDLLTVELPKDAVKPEKDKVAAFQKLGTMYVRYIQIFRKIEECYDQITHPQKCRLIRHVLDGTMGRILELKGEMVNLELLEYQYFDDILTDMKLTPSDLEVPIPHYFVTENGKVLKEREKMLGSILARIGPPDIHAKDDIDMTTDDAIKYIQIHERARQGRLRAKFMKDIRAQEERERQAQLRGPPKLNRDEAATTIQKIWRGFSQRKAVNVMRKEELMFLDMVVPPVQTSTQKNSAVAQLKKTEVSSARKWLYYKLYITRISVV